MNVVADDRRRLWPAIAWSVACFLILGLALAIRPLDPETSTPQPAHPEVLNPTRATVKVAWSVRHLPDLRRGELKIAFGGEDTRTGNLGTTTGQGDQRVWSSEVDALRHPVFVTAKVGEGLHVGLKAWIEVGGQVVPCDGPSDRPQAMNQVSCTHSLG